jgi:hypothetical protein
MAIADDRQRYMPQPDDRSSGKCQILAYPEAVLLVNPTMPDHKGEVLFHSDLFFFFFFFFNYYSLFIIFRMIISFIYWK